MNIEFAEAKTSQTTLRSRGKSYNGRQAFDPTNHFFIEGTPIRQVKGGFLVDIGSKCDAFCPDKEIGEAQLNEANVFIQTGGKEDEMTVLSRKLAQHWEPVGDFIIEQTTLFAEPVRRDGDRSKLIVRLKELPEYDIELPAWESSQRLEYLLNKKPLIPVVIKSIAPTRGRDGRIVVSNRKIDSGNKPAQLKKIRVGRVVEGRILKFLKASKTDQDSSAFVLLEGGAVALLHRHEVRGYPEKKLEQIFKIGDPVSVAVTKKNKLACTMFYPELRKVFNSLNRGDIVEGCVVKENNGSYSLELGRGIYGRLYPEDLNVAEGKPEQLKLGSTIRTVVLECSARDLLLKLGRRQLQAQVA